MPDNIHTAAILKKFQIETLNSMQEEAYASIKTGNDLILLSPTGTGKTLAFVLPLIERLDKDSTELQLLIVVPSRELAQQIEQVIRKMGSGFKVNAVYGGRAGMMDKQDLKHTPAILIGTPGRIADRFRRDNYSLDHIKTLVLDEFDKSLEIGFHEEMEEIIETLPNLQQRILTSATTDAEIPRFVGLRNPATVDYLKDGNTQLAIKVIYSPAKDKLHTLKEALAFIGHQPGIIFCNVKDALHRISDYLNDNDIDHSCFHGGMEQIDRERSLIKFRNGTNQILLATDLAARGLDITEIKFIIHYHLPPREKEFTHRNGRTARMNRDGTAYILHWKNEPLPDFIQDISPEENDIEDLSKSTLEPPVKWTTLYITGGRRDKISKGDVAGLFYKQGQLKKEQLGTIEIKQNCTYVGVHSEVVKDLIDKVNNSKLKKKKVRVSIIG